MIRALIFFSCLLCSGFSNAEEASPLFMSKTPVDFKAPLPENDYDKNLLSKIEELGWFNLHIAEEGESPAYAFTIGHFHKQSHPELIVIGLKAEVAHKLLNIAVIKIVGAEEKLEPYKQYSDFTEGLSVAFVPVELKYYNEYLGYADWYYGSMPKPYPTMQMVWPDREGLYPWEQGYDQKFKKLQPILGPMP